MPLIELLSERFWQGIISLLPSYALNVFKKQEGPYRERSHQENIVEKRWNESVNSSLRNQCLELTVNSTTNNKRVISMFLL